MIVETITQKISVFTRVGISVSVDIQYRLIHAIIGKTNISVSVVALVPIYWPNTYGHNGKVLSHFRCRSSYDKAISAHRLSYYNLSSVTIFVCPLSPRSFIDLWAPDLGYSIWRSPSSYYKISLYA